MVNAFYPNMKLCTMTTHLTCLVNIPRLNAANARITIFWFLFDDYKYILYGSLFLRNGL